MRRYHNSLPRWIDARFASTCSCGHKIQKGESILYMPQSKTAKCKSCGEQEERDRDARAFDEVVADSGHSPW